MLIIIVLQTAAYMSKVVYYIIVLKLGCDVYREECWLFV